MIQKIFKEYKIKAKKSLWQNFLVNEDIVEEIANSININWKNIIEVWPGYGALTQKLLEKNPNSLTLIELDNDMIDILNDRIKKSDLKVWNINFNIKNIDVLKYSPEFKNYFVIANIPYYITSPILRHFLYDVEKKPEKMLILMQKDVGDKIIKGQLKEEKITKKNKNKTSVLSLFIAKKAKVKELLFVWKQNFIPAPKVESSVLLFEKHNLYNDIDDKKFLEFIKKWFSEPRKKLIKNLLKAWFDKQKLLDFFDKFGFNQQVRPEDLNLDEWILLLKNI